MNNTVQKGPFWISHGNAATVYRWVGQMYKLLMSNFLRI